MKNAVFAALVCISLGTSAQTVPDPGGRYAVLFQRSTPVLQVSFPEPEDCGGSLALAEATIESMKRYRAICIAADLAMVLPFHVVVQEEMFGTSVEIAMRTKSLCQDIVKEVKKLKAPDSGKSYFKLVGDCKPLT